ncbi:MAG: hypothetical protein ACRENN_10060, partial [Candidatus Eiseniibacteriota bacterium]
DGLHPVREVFTTDDVLNIVIRRPRSLLTARPELLIAMEGASSESVRIMVQFDVRARWAYLLDTMRRNKPVPVAMRVLSDTVEFKIPRPWETASGAPSILFTKLDDSGTRRLGFFDSAGWRRFDAGEPARGDDLHRGSETTSPEAQLAAAVRVQAQNAECEVAPDRP